MQIARCFLNTTYCFASTIFLNFSVCIQPESAEADFVSLDAYRKLKDRKKEENIPPDANDWVFKGAYCWREREEEVERVMVSILLRTTITTTTNFLWPVVLHSPLNADVLNDNFH